MPRLRPNEVVLDEIPSRPEKVLPALTGPIRIEPGDGGRLVVVVPFDPNRVAKIKTVAGRHWHPKEQYWTVPHTEGALPPLLALFFGEPVTVDPSLRPVEALNNQERVAGRMPAHRRGAHRCPGFASALHHDLIRSGHASSEQGNHP